MEDKILTIEEITEKLLSDERIAVFNDLKAKFESFKNNVVVPNDIEITDFNKGVIFRSPDNSRWKITIDNLGSITRTKIV